MYIVFATESGSAPGADATAAFDFLRMDDAARHCIELAQSGYTIQKVVLPNGTTIEGDQVQAAITSGLSSVRVAISRLRA